MAGFFDKLFDFNHDGKLDAFERAAKFDFLDSMAREEEKKAAQRGAQKGTGRPKRSAFDEDVLEEMMDDGDDGFDDFGF